MTALTQWNPFKRLLRLDPAASFENLFRDSGLAPMLRDFDAASEIPLDVTENAESYCVKAQIPGVDKNDIDVSVDGNRVAISAEFRREEKKDGERELCIERYYGKAFRAFTLPDDLDAAKTSASYDNGVLTLSLPKKHNGDARRIAVS